LDTNSALAKSQTERLTLPKEEGIQDNGSRQLDQAIAAGRHQETRKLLNDTV
jgi:hypothetical protein